MNFDDFQIRARRFEAAAHKILGVSEAAGQSRVVLIEPTYKRIGDLTVKQDDMLRQAIRCVQMEVFRAAHVLGWAAMADYLQENVAKDGFTAINAVRPKWNITSVEGLREQYTEHALIDAMYAAKQITKSEMKAFFGLLNKRNECAHPSDYFPGLNESLGFVSEVIKRIESHKKRLGKS